MNGNISDTEAHGIVEVYRNGTWKLICTWSLTPTDAAVICHQLGYRHGQALPPAAYGPFQGNYTEVFTGCDGGEVSILDCRFETILADRCIQENTYYASIYCYNDTKMEPGNN